MNQQNRKNKYQQQRNEITKLSLSGPNFFPKMNPNPIIVPDNLRALRINRGNIQQSQGYEILIEPPKEICVNSLGEEKLKQLISRFYALGQIKMQIYFPNKLSESEKNDLCNEFSDLGITINDYKFKDEDLYFFQRIHKFQGQYNGQNKQDDSLDIPPLVQMLILNRRLFSKISQDAEKLGYSVNFDYHRLLCQVPTPNKQQIEIQHLQIFFTDKVSAPILNSKILEVSCDSFREAQIKSKLLTNFINKNRNKLEGVDGGLVLLSQQYIDSLLQKEGVQNIGLDKWSDKLYFVVIENDANNKTSIEELQQKLNIFIKTNLKKNSFNRKINFENSVFCSSDQLANDNEIEIQINQGIQTLLSQEKIRQNLDICVNKCDSRKQQIYIELGLREYYTELQNAQLNEAVINEICFDIQDFFLEFVQIKLNEHETKIWKFYCKEIIGSQATITENFYDNGKKINLQLGQQIERSKIKKDIFKQLQDYQIKELNIPCSDQIIEILQQFSEVNLFLKEELD